MPKHYIEGCILRREFTGVLRLTQAFDVVSSYIGALVYAFSGMSRAGGLTFEGLSFV